MQTHVDFSSITELFEKARIDARNYLFEYEVYDLIRHVGSETPPRYLVVPKSSRLTQDEIENLPGEKVVIKVVSAFILHKSDVGGVRIVKKTIEAILSAQRAMYYEIPVQFGELVMRGKFDLPGELAGLSGASFEKTVRDSIEGVVLCQYMHPDSMEFGNELLVSLRRTREFGMILSAGLGGTDTELYAKRFKKGQAVVAASTEMVSGEEFFHLFKKTISYRKLAGLTRGQKRIVTDEQLLECFSALIEIGNYFSPLNEETEHVIEELEINPFAFTNYLMMPLDGLCRFSRKKKRVATRPIENIDKLLHPQSIGIAGVSSKGVNIGRIILDNIISLGFPREAITLIHPNAKQISNIDTVAKLGSIPEKLDMLILAVNGEVIPELIDQVLENDIAHGVVLVPGGFGDEERKEQLLDDVLQKIEKSRSEGGKKVVFLGGNSLGILSRPGKYDGLFIPESKLPKTLGKHTRRSGLVSQSGAYMITRMSKLSFLDPAYAVSIGNQVDLTAADFLRYFKGVNVLDTLAFYMEGFADLDGLEFCRAVKETLPLRKEIILYKAGRTEEGKTAMSGHTASIAGDYMVCESCLEQSGAFVAETFSEFEGLLRLSTALHAKKVRGSRLAAVSNAGYESVGIADNILGEGYSLQLAHFSEKTLFSLDEFLGANGLAQLVTVANPMDVTPMANEAVYEGVITRLLGDENVDLVIVAIVPLTPLLHTLPDEYIKDDSLEDGNGIVGRITALNRESDKPIVMVVDSGSLYDHMAEGLEKGGMAVFRSADHAVRTLGKYVQQRLKIEFV